MKRTIAAIIIAGTLFTGCATPTVGPTVSPTQGIIAPSETVALTPTPMLGPTPTIVTVSPSPSLSPAPSPTVTATSPGSFHLVTPADGLPTGAIRNLWIASDGHLWVATEAGILVHADEDWIILYDGPVERLLGADADGRIWTILEGGAAIAAYDPSGTWSFYGSDQGWTIPPPQDYLSPGYGDGLVTDPRGQVWWATGQDDLRCFDPKSQTWKIFSATEIGFDPPEEEGYQGHFITDVELSRNAEVWVGDCVGMGELHLGQGIRWTDGDGWFGAPFTAGECVQDIEVDDAGRMWLGGFDALLQYDPATDSWSRIPLPPWERRQLVVNITLDREGNPWVEILRYGGASPLGEVAHYHLQNGTWVMDFDGWFGSLAFGTAAEAWACSEGSVYRLESGQAEEVGAVSGLDCQIIVDGTGRVWVTDHTNLWWLEPDN
ncbi:MAG: hypothetical protein WBH57_02275 [Anaerolineae bacterium]